MNEQEFLTSYSPSSYRTPDGFPTDTVIFTLVTKPGETKYRENPKRELKILLIQRKEHPYKGKWALPGGFSRANEPLLMAAKRELKEETNIGDDFYLNQLKTVYYPGRDPRPSQTENEKAWMPTAVYFAFVKEEHLKNLRAGDDAKEAQLFTIEEAKSLEFAFDHDKIIYGGLQPLCGEEVMAYQHLQTQVLSTPIAKDFLPKAFPLSELYSLLKTIVPSFSAEKNNMYRLVGSNDKPGLLKEVRNDQGEVLTTKQYSSRPSKLFCFNEDYTYLPTLYGQPHPF